MYIEVDDLKKMLSEEEIIELTDDESTGEMNEDVVQGVISDAESEVNSYLTARYPIPLNPVPQIIKKLSVDIAVYNLFSRRLQDDPPENVRKRYEDAIKLLQMIARGDIVLSASIISRAKGFVKDNEQVFNRDRLQGF